MTGFWQKLKDFFKPQDVPDFHVEPVSDNSVFVLNNKIAHEYPILPKQYEWLYFENGPRILKEALKLYGTLEAEGSENNPMIMAWAKEVGGWIGDWYEGDHVPWCGLFMAVVAQRAHFPFNQKALSALEWQNWGQESHIPMLGDVLVFKRKGGGHVGLYVGEDSECYHVLGGNQSDAVSFTRIRKIRLVESRRCPWRVAQPVNVRRIMLSESGDISENEA